MAWYDDSWLYRVPVYVDTSDATPVGAIDVSISVPPIFDLFWDNVMSNGHDVRLTDADGWTLLTYQRQTWTYASKSAVLEIDDWTPSASNGNQVCWLYWGNSGASDAAGSFTAASAKTGTIDISAPAGVVIRAAHERPGQTRPAVTVSKTTNETIFIYWDITDHLIPVNGSANDRRQLEEVSAVEVAQAAISGDTGSVTVSSAGNRVIEFQGRTYVRTSVAGGTDDNRYILTLTVHTMSAAAAGEDRLLDFRCSVHVVNPAA